jgi:hypothetical protein
MLLMLRMPRRLGVCGPRPIDRFDGPLGKSSTNQNLFYFANNLYYPQNRSWVEYGNTKMTLHKVLKRGILYIILLHALVLLLYSTKAYLRSAFSRK